MNSPRKSVQPTWRSSSPSAFVWTSACRKEELSVLAIFLCPFFVFGGSRCRCSGTYAVRRQQVFRLGETAPPCVRFLPLL
ncbi:hypothetical protein FKM82_021265 [Ascaphus truei]